MSLISLRSRPKGQVNLRLRSGARFKKILLTGTLLIVFIIAGTLRLSAGEGANGEMPSTPPFFPVTGKILNDKNEPLFGATVTVKGTRNSVVTDKTGSFTIDAEKGTVLVISSVGYRETEVTVGDEGTALNITLELVERSLDEVVVIGYGTTKRRDLTGSIVSVKPKEITARPGSKRDGIIAGKSGRA